MVKKCTEQSFHDWMPGPGYYAKVITGARGEENNNAKTSKIKLQSMTKSMSTSGMMNKSVVTRKDIEKEMETNLEYFIVLVHLAKTNVSHCQNY